MAGDNTERDRSHITLICKNPLCLTFGVWRDMEHFILITRREDANSVKSEISKSSNIGEK